MADHAVRIRTPLLHVAFRAQRQPLGCPVLEGEHAGGILGEPVHAVVGPEQLTGVGAAGQLVAGDTVLTGLGCGEQPELAGGQSMQPAPRQLVGHAARVATQMGGISPAQRLF